MEVRENILGYLEEELCRQGERKYKGLEAGLWLACLGKSKEVRSEEPSAGERAREEIQEEAGKALKAL